MTTHEVDDAREWDERYAGVDEHGRMWSGRPNGALVAEVAELTPGTALDVGCGEGADAIWLARRGWRVTAVDPSGVALARAEAAARDAGVEVTWVRSGLLEVPGGPGVHDLVSAQYAVLRHTPDDAAITTLLGAVAPGGTLLVVHHDPAADHGPDGAAHGPDHVHGHHADHGADHGAGHGFDPADHVMPADVLAHLGDGWQVEVHETRPRVGPLPADALAVPDLVLRARRLATPDA